ncbi:hypothetical protein NE699_25540, partial [Escherichia coli]|nr:hypothetical protein [Escherichia coli]
NLSPEFHGLTKEQAPSTHLAKSSRRVPSNKCVGDIFRYRRIFCQRATFGSPLFFFIFLFFA